MVEGCVDASLVAAWICWCALALGSHLLPAKAALPVQWRLAGFSSQVLKEVCR